MVSKCQILAGGKIVIQILAQDNRVVFGEMFNEEDVIFLFKYYKSHFEFNGLSIRPTANEEEAFTKYIMVLVGQAFKSVQNFFSKKNMYYVGPLRANPQRYYFLDDADTNTTLDYRIGASLAEILKKNKEVLDKINDWLERFDLDVTVEEFKDVIHNIKVTQNHLKLDIPDVGFGVSQLLPILVGGMMSSPQSTIIIEQPEIHLHPKMQAELAELFIDILKGQTEKHLIIETHSEYIIKRIRRCMAEGKLDPKHVAIYFVMPRNKDNPETARIQLAPIFEDGTIEWPEDFYMTELEDELAFFKAKTKKK